MKIRFRSVALLLVGVALGFCVRGRLRPLAGSYDGENTSSTQSHTATLNLKEEKLSFREHFNDQLPRILFLLLFWGVIALAVVFMIKSDMVDAKTKIDPAVENYLDERLNIWVALFEIFVFVFVTGISALFVENRFVIMAQEEICRFFYNLGAFISWMIIVLLYFYVHTGAKAVHWTDWVLVPIVLAGYMSLGFLLSWLFKWRLGRLNN